MRISKIGEDDDKNMLQSKSLYRFSIEIHEGYVIIRLLEPIFNILEVDGELICKQREEELVKDERGQIMTVCML